MLTHGTCTGIAHDLVRLRAMLGTGITCENLHTKKIQRLNSVLCQRYLKPRHWIQLTIDQLATLIQKLAECLLTF
jgi:hypothetical protein